MYHYNETVTNRTGDSLSGYFLRLVDPTSLGIVSIFADESGTPISTTSGVENMAKTDGDGLPSLYVGVGTYHVDCYSSDATTFIKRIPLVPMGIASNVADTLASLKAASTTVKAMYYDRAWFTWTLGNYTGLADDVNIIQADGISLSVGARVRQDASAITAIDGAAGSIFTTIAGFIAKLMSSAGSSIVGYLGPWTGANARDQADKNTDTLSVFDFIPKAQHAAILARTSTYDATADIQKAIDAATAQQRRLIIPAGLYVIVPATAFADEGNLGTLAAFIMRSNMDIVAELGATFRIKNGVSTDVAPQSMGMFCNNQVLSNVSIVGLTMDMNGANNPISPNRIALRAGTISLTNGSAGVVGVGTSFTTQAKVGWTILVGIYAYSVLSVTDDTHLTLSANAAASLATQAYSAGRYADLNQSQILVSGTPSGVAAHIDNARIEKCTFINNPGVSCLCMAQTNISNTALGSGWRVLNNTFSNNGGDSTDHSSVYGWAEDILFDGNLLTNDNQFTTVGGVVGYEVHGSRTIVTNNIFRNYYRGVWCSENFTRATENVLIANNLFDKMKAAGVEYFGQVAATVQGKNSKITGNTVVFDNLIHPGLDIKAGFSVASSYSQTGIEITNNTVRATGTAVGSALAQVGASAVAAQVHSDILIAGNKAILTSIGVVVRGNATNTLGPVTIKNNRYYNLTPAGAFGTPLGTFIDGSTLGITRLTIHYNDCIDDRGSPQFAYGTYLQGTIGTLDYRAGAISGLTSGAYNESITVTTRLGSYSFAIAYDPPSLASGAKDTIQTTTFAGAALKHTVTTVFGVDLAGVRIPAWVSAPNTISYYAINENGANPTNLANAALTFMVEARA